jgi:flavin-dependent dehydrogenase
MSTVSMSLRAEVTVIGAGPAGSMAAYYLTKGNKDTLLIDCSRFPREKVCGDLLGFEALQELARLDIIPDIEWGDLCSRVSTWQIFDMDGNNTSRHLTSPAGAPTHTFVVPRFVLDETLRKRALDAGARWGCPWRCTSFEQLSSDRFLVRAIDHRGTNLSIETNAVVCAAGSGSIFARPDHPKCDDRLLIAGRRYYEDVDLPLGHYKFYYRDYLPLHYGWIFPLPGRRANVGIGMRVSALQKTRMSLAYALDQMIHEVNDARLSLASGRIHGKFKPVLLKTALQPGVLQQSGILFVGDAAGLANPFNGEGIGPAMVSGRTAAETLVNGFNPSQPEYTRLITSRYGTLFECASGVFEARHRLLEAVAGK